MTALGLLLVLGLAAASIVALVRAIVRIRREETTGIQCQGCLQDVRRCCCPLSVER